MAALAEAVGRVCVGGRQVVELRYSPRVVREEVSERELTLYLAGKTRWYVCGVRLPRRLAWWIARRLA